MSEWQMDEYETIAHLEARAEAAEARLREIDLCNDGLVPGAAYREACDRANAAERKLARVSTLAEKWRYKGEFGWGAWQEGYGPDHEGYVLDQASAELRAALADEETT